jgi:hypothetical protein
LTVNGFSKKVSSNIENEPLDVKTDEEPPEQIEKELSEITIDSEKLKRGIVAGSVIAGLYFFDYFTTEEWYEKDKNGNFISKRKDLIKEIYD